MGTLINNKFAQSFPTVRKCVTVSENIGKNNNWRRLSKESQDSTKVSVKLSIELIDLT